jgi:arginine utilization regulatory protein
MENLTLMKIFNSIGTYLVITDSRGQIKNANSLFLDKSKDIVFGISNISFIDYRAYDMLKDNKQEKIEIELFDSVHILEKFQAGNDFYFIIRKKVDTQTNRIYEKVVNSINERIVASDKDGNVLLFNKASENYEKMNGNEIVGKNITELYNLTDESSLLKRVIRSGEPLLNVHQNSINNMGLMIDDMVDTWPIFDQGELFGAVSIMTDYTKIESLSKQIIDLQSKLIKMDESNDDQSPLSAKYSFNDIICSSANMTGIISVAKRAAKSTSPVLIHGETGTGKELFAQSIHNYSKNSKGPFVAINCAAIPDNLLEGLLFGTVKGAFSDAIDRPGLFEQAENGTILLDELNSMSLNLQSKLLRVLQENKTRRVGGSKEININTRVITAMNENPIRAVKENKIRQDLFYRIGVVLIEVPPLRNRKEDIPLLSKNFILKFNRKLDRQITKLSADVFDSFAKYDWPGNVRELQHTIEYAMNIAHENERIIELSHLPLHISESYEIPAEKEGPWQTLEKRLNVEEIKILENELIKNDWKIAQTAKKLGLKRQSLQYRIKKYSLKNN